MSVSECFSLSLTITLLHLHTHIYSLSHFQVRRVPRAFPKIELTPGVASDHTSIDGFSFSDFKIVGYAPDKPIKMKMAV